jgi:hypothetical protein
MTGSSGTLGPPTAARGKSPAVAALRGAAGLADSKAGRVPWPSLVQTWSRSLDSNTKWMWASFPRRYGNQINIPATASRAVLPSPLHSLHQGVCCRGGSRSSHWVGAFSRILCGWGCKKLSLDSPFVSPRQNCRVNQLLFLRLSVVSSRESRARSGCRNRPVSFGTPVRWLWIRNYTRPYFGSSGNSSYLI